MALATVALGFAALAGCGDDDEPAAPLNTPSSSSSNSPVTSTSSPASTDPDSTTEATSPGSTSARTTESATNAPSGNNTSGSTSTPTTPPAADPPPPGPGGDFSVAYPPGWGPSGQVQATAFATDAVCGSALIVDRALPDDAGPGASIEQSYVQVCWKDRGGQSLTEFMAATYGSTAGFEATTLAGRPAFVSRAGDSSTYFVDTSDRRYQITTAVAASAELKPTRLGQVEQILGSLTLPN